MNNTKEMKKKHFQLGLKLTKFVYWIIVIAVILRIIILFCFEYKGINLDLISDKKSSDAIYVNSLKFIFSIICIRYNNNAENGIVKVQDPKRYGIYLPVA